MKRHSKQQLSFRRRHRINVLVACIAMGLLVTMLAARSSSVSATSLAAAAETAKAKPKPKATPRPSFEVEGSGALLPTGNCSQNGCPGAFSSTLSGPPFGKLDLNLAVTVDSNPVNPSSSCFASTGFGQFGSTDNQNNGFNASFAGQLCTGPSYAYSLQGVLEIVPTQPCQVTQTVSVGTLAMYGAVHQSGPTPIATPSNPIPAGSNSGAVVSIVGVSGQIPAPCPSP
jgi:hypothetical protein